MNEEAFLAQYNPLEYDSLAVTVDNVVFGIDTCSTENYRKLDKQKLTILLVKREHHPDMGKWSLPGGFVGKNETLEAAALRSLGVKTGLCGLYLEQLYTFGEPDRDPRMRIVSCAYLTLIDRSEVDIKNSWFEVELYDNMLFLSSQDEKLIIPLVKSIKRNGKLETAVYHAVNVLAFDHADIILEGLFRLRGKLWYSDLVFNLIPEKFTLTSLQRVFEIILGEKQITAAFRRKIENRLIPTDEYSQNKGHRPSQYFKYGGNLK